MGAAHSNSFSEEATEPSKTKKKPTQGKSVKSYHNSPNLQKNAAMSPNSKESDERFTVKTKEINFEEKSQERETKPVSNENALAKADGTSLFADCDKSLEKKASLFQFIEKTLSDKEKQVHQSLKTVSFPIELMYSHEQAAALSEYDPREPVPKHELKHYPCSAIVRIEASFDNVIYGGSGSLIGSCHALTARHNVFNIETDQWTNSVRVIPAQNNDEEPFGSAFVKQIFIFRDCDLALLVLNKKFDSIQFLEMGIINKPTDLNDNKKVRITGYPWKNTGNVGTNTKMYTNEDVISKIDNQKFEIGYKTYTSMGQSGSPILMQDKRKGKQVVVGVHTRGSGMVNGIRYGVLLNSARFNQIQAWIRQKAQNEQLLLEIYGGTNIIEVDAPKEEEKYERKIMPNVSRPIAKTANYPEEISNIEQKEISEMELQKLLDQVELKLLEKMPYENVDIINFSKFQDNRMKLALRREDLGRNEITDEDIKELAGRMQLAFNESQVHELELDLNGCLLISDTGISELARRIGTNMKNIKWLELDFGWCQEITNKGISEISKEIGPNAQNVEHLKLDFNWCEKISDAGVSRFSRELGAKLKNIQDLQLDFSWCKEISDLGIGELSLQIGLNMGKIRKLALSFAGCEKISDLGISELGIQFTRNPKQIQHLNLDFSWCQQISDTGVANFARYLRPSIKNIQQLELNFEGCEKISDFGLSELVRNIGRKIRKINHLRLSFILCKISDRGISQLARQIGPNLKKIQGIQITDEGLIELARHLRPNIKNIQHLYLDFSWCQEISDIGISQLTKRTGPNLQNIQHLQIDFNGCKKITIDGMKSLAQNIEPSTKNIKKIWIDLTSTKVNQQETQYLKDLFKFIPDLWISP